MFSPNLEIKLVNSSLTLNPLSEKGESINVLTELIFLCKELKCFHKKFWKTSFLATKSVSEFISKITPILSIISTVISPSDADRKDFFELY